MANHPPTNRSESSEWQACPAGQLQQMVGELNTRDRRIRTMRIVKTSSLCIAVVAAGMLAAGFGYEFLMPGGITCQQCGTQFAAYEQHLNGTEAMPDDQAEQMQEHLAHCSHCRPVFEKRYPGLLAIMNPENLFFAFSQPLAVSR